jgi:hypothetical protein
MTRLREEIMTKVGPADRPTYDHIRDMKYLRAVINGICDFLWLVLTWPLTCSFYRNYEGFFSRVSHFNQGSLTSLIEFSRPFNVRYVRHPTFIRNADIMIAKVSTHPLYLQPVPWISQYTSLQRQGIVMSSFQNFQRNAGNDYSVGYSVFLMHRRKDLWGPDGTEDICFE